MSDSFWNRLHDATADSEGFTVNFWLEGGHVIRDVATMPAIDSRIEGERIDSNGIRWPIAIRTAAVVAYEIEES